MEYIYNPKGVCSRQFVFDIEDGVINSVKIMGGCHGNLQGIAALVNGMDADEIIDKLSGIKCGFKATSCPDQLACAIRKAKENA